MKFITIIGFVLVAFAFNKTDAIYRGWKADRSRDRSIIRHVVHFGRVGCSGVLISWNHVLTAAHCPIEVGDTAFIGTSDRNDVNRGGIALPVVASTKHSGYYKGAYNREPKMGVTLAGESKNDLRVVTLGAASSSEMMARGVAPAPIDWNTHSWYPGKTVKLRAAGFGSTTVKCKALTTRLQLGDVYTTKCEKYPRAFPGADSSVQFCLDGTKGGQTVCKGDSGGPVFYKNGKQWVLVGIVSGGEYAGGNCCVPREKWHATNVAGFRSWITSQMQESAHSSDWSCMG